MPEQKDYVDLSMAAKLFPGDPNTSAIWRWCRKGIKARNGGESQRVKLEHVRIGGKLYTTQQWANEFIAKLAAADGGAVVQPQPPTNSIWNDLARVVEAWPDLSADERAGILRLAGCRHGAMGTAIQPAPIQSVEPLPAIHPKPRTAQQREASILAAEKEFASWR